jgi:transcriptional regulator with XRE-family HTH domain
MSIPLKSPADFGRIVRAARKSNGLRQDDAAGATGVSDVFLWQLEKGAPGARLGKVLQVLAGLGVELRADVNDATRAAYDALQASTRAPAESPAQRKPRSRTKPSA